MTIDVTTGELHLAAPAVAASIPRLRTAVASFAAAAGAHDAVVHAVRLAVSEALSNAVLHAHVGEAVVGSITTIAVREADGSLLVVVEDDGCGMRPRADSPGLGLGLATISAVSSGFEASRSVSGGTRLCMRFDLVRAPQRA